MCIRDRKNTWLICSNCSLIDDIYIYNYSVGASIFQGFCCTSRTSPSWDIALILVSKKTCTSFSFRPPLWLWMRGRRGPRSTPQYEEFFFFLTKTVVKKKEEKKKSLFCLSSIDNNSSERELVTCTLHLLSCWTVMAHAVSRDLWPAALSMISNVSNAPR